MNIFQFGKLAAFCSASWLLSVRQVGCFLFGKLAVFCSASWLLSIRQFGHLTFGNCISSRSVWSVNSDGKSADAGAVGGDGDFAVDDFGAVEAVVGYEEVAVEVGPLGKRRQL